MTKRGALTPPHELEELRTAMPWLWRGVTDWDIPIRAEVFDIDNRRNLQHLVTPGISLLHIRREFGRLGERVVKTNVFEHLPIKSRRIPLRRVVRTLLPPLKLEQGAERLMEIAMITDRMDHLHLQIYCCTLSEGFKKLV